MVVLSLEGTILGVISHSLNHTTVRKGQYYGEHGRHVRWISAILATVPENLGPIV
jgi:hypothetical protein